jgi:hypothetical protein
MIRIADCWSRMLSRLIFVRKGSLLTDRTAKRMRNGMRIPPRRR